MDHGKYHSDYGQYDQALRDMIAANPPITLGPEYADFITNNALQLLIRLARYKFVARMIKSADDVLEVGSGAGLGAIFLGQHAQRVTGIEIKEHDIAEANATNRRGNVHFTKTDFFDYRPERPHDALVCLDVIEHLQPEVGEAFIAHMPSMLNDAGMAIVGTPSIYSYPYQGKLSRASHVKCYDQAELVGVMDRYFARTLTFSMNDELVHTGFAKLAWYYFVIGLVPRRF